MKSEGAIKISASRASKIALTLHSCMTTSKSLSGQPNPDLIQRLARQVVIQLCHVGAHFEALDALIFMAPSHFIAIFYVPRLTSGTMCKDLRTYYVIYFVQFLR